MSRLAAALLCIICQSISTLTEKITTFHLIVPQQSLSLLPHCSFSFHSVKLQQSHSLSITNLTTEINTACSEIESMENKRSLKESRYDDLKCIKIRQNIIKYNI